MRIFKVLLLFAVTIVLATAVQAGTVKDTPQSLMDRAKSGEPQSAALVATFTDVNSYLTRLSSDSAFAEKLIDAVNKNDKNAAAALIKSVAPKSDITIVNMKDGFTLEVGFHIPFTKKSVTVCVSTEHLCSNTNFTAVIE